jgi:hypothetical protein
MVPCLRGDDLVDALRLETHGFVGFGYLHTDRNNWLGRTEDGTGEFWEAAANVIARPVDRLRLGAQLFVRDLVKYDNGHVDLDWAYADYRFADEVGLQVGRFKLPLGLFNDSLDIDAGRSAIFLPVSIYSPRSREFFISTDGAKVYGLIDLGGAGSLEYATFAGTKDYHLDGGFATAIAEGAGATQLTEMEIDHLAGFMLHWNTPVDDLGARLTLAAVDDFVFQTDTAIRTQVDYRAIYLSLLYEPGVVTLAAEYQRLHGRGGITVAGAPFGSYVDNGDGAYLSCTWHVRPWFDAYAALEGAWDDAYRRDQVYAYTGVLAANVLPSPHWSVKLELRAVRGTLGINAVDNPAGIDDRWGVLALKTTVDF